ncbi:MAG: GTPase Era [Fimbriimonadaceae bacterium]|nr:GTPase Era [Chitinophagales bacterium]
MENFKSGFVNIIGKPNAGKSTLLNILVGEKLASITPKAQTTRRRLLGIVTTDTHQIIYSDTPGIVKDPMYKLHEWMNTQIEVALHDADIILYMVNPGEKTENNPILEKIIKSKIPACIVLNKMDIIDEKRISEEEVKWKTFLPDTTLISISALQKKNIATLQEFIIDNLPVHPPYYDSDELTDVSERFMMSEMIRAEILKQYKQEIPYSVEVIVHEFKEKEDITVIKATIYTGKDSHKNIIIGPKGTGIKKVGTESRKEMEAWLGKKVFLELFVKVKENWKNDERSLKYFGYDS